MSNSLGALRRQFDGRFERGLGLLRVSHRQASPADKRLNRYGILLCRLKPGGGLDDVRVPSGLVERPKIGGPGVRPSEPVQSDLRVLRFEAAGNSRRDPAIKVRRFTTTARAFKLLRLLKRHSSVLFHVSRVVPGVTAIIVNWNYPRFASDEPGSGSPRPIDGRGIT